LGGHAAVALDTNTALVCGGDNHGAAQSACFKYVAASDAWSAAPQLNTARYYHGMTVLKGRVLVYGGCDGVNCARQLAIVEMLSTDERTWAALPTPMFKADNLFASVPLP